LQIDAPDVVRLTMQQCRAPGVKRRIDPKPALGWKFGSHLDVGNQELVLEHLAREVRSHHAPQCRARAIAGDEMTGCEAIRPVRRVDRQHDVIVALLERAHLVAPAQIDGGQFLRAIDQIGFGVELLKIDEGRALVPLLGQQIELVELRGAVKDFSDAPDHAFVDHAAADAEPIPEFQRAFREADCARALADAVGVIEQNDALAALRQIDRERQSDRPSTDDYDRMMRGIGLAPLLIGVTTIAELGFGRLRHDKTALIKRSD